MQNMIESQTAIEGVRLIDLRVFPDNRGSFCEAYRHTRVGGEACVQWNVSRSKQGVVRGLHLHRRQSDYWHLVAGRAYAGLVDLRPDSKTYKVALGLMLEESRPQSLLIPPGVVHGFRALTDVVLMYLLDREYDPTDELGVRWNDPALGLPPEWYSSGEAIVSERDRTAPRLQDAGAIGLP
jgi:dTDP-4-dehydrorhamnose 3,5-epimerase